MNIILIGMPGAGKSTIGVVLAKMMGMNFLDTDIVIQQKNGELLQSLIDERGMDGFLDAESTAVRSIGGDHMVIATGGSVVYRESAMRHLKSLGTVIYLELPYSVIRRRIHNPATRGIAIGEGQTLKTLYDERVPLYQKYADIIMPCKGRSVTDVIDQIKKQV